MHFIAAQLCSDSGTGPRVYRNHHNKHAKKQIFGRLAYLQHATPFPNLEKPDGSGLLQHGDTIRLNLEESSRYFVGQRWVAAGAANRAATAAAAARQPASQPTYQRPSAPAPPAG